MKYITINVHGKTESRTSLVARLRGNLPQKEFHYHILSANTEFEVIRHSLN